MSENPMPQQPRWLAAPTGEPRWPRAMAKVSCLLAVFQLLWVIVSLSVRIESMVRHPPKGQLSDAFLTWDLFAGPVNIVLGIVLLAGGIQLARRRPVTWLLHHIFAYGTIALGVAVLPIFLEGYAHGIYPPEHKSDTIIGWTLRFAYPFFCIAWFGRKHIRAQVAAWATRPAPSAPGHRWRMVVASISCIMAVILIPANAWSLNISVTELIESLKNSPRMFTIALGACLVADGGLVFSVVHLIAGIQLVRRKPITAILYLVYAIGSLAVTALVCPLSAWYFSTVSTKELAGWYSGWYTGLLIGTAYPIFCIAWFSRQEIRRQIEAWGTPGSESDANPAAATNTVQTSAPVVV